MAIDAGTGSVRAVLFDLKGNQIGCSQHEWTHNEDPRFPGSMDFDWKYDWELASGCVRNVLAETKIDPAEIAAISTTCMREGILLYDKDGNEIWACANVDARSNDEVAELIRMNLILNWNCIKNPDKVMPLMRFHVFYGLKIICRISMRKLLKSVCLMTG